MLQWTTPVLLPEAEWKIDSGYRLLLTGSCFSTQIGERLLLSGWHTTMNPAGVQYNPFSMAAQIRRWMLDDHPSEQELFFHEGLWRHADWHSSFAAPTKEAALAALTESVAAGRQALQEANVLLLTPGTAKVYERRSDTHLMANNHKLPAGLLNSRMLGYEEVLHGLSELLHDLATFRPDLRVILTLSPVRHVRDGLSTNARSKAILLAAMRAAADTHAAVSYFPSYEIMMDELRDYRFYEADMIHPNAVATDHIWKAFQQVYFADKEKQQVKDMERYQAMLRHRVMHPDTPEAKQFLEKLLELKNSIGQLYPNIRWPEAE